MARCQGTTKSGDRCKRSAPEGKDFCSIHQPVYAKAANGETKRAETTGAKQEREPAREERKPREKLVGSKEDFVHLLLGAAATLAVLYVIKRGPGLPGL